MNNKSLGDAARSPEKLFYSARGPSTINRVLLCTVLDPKETEFKEAPVTFLQLCTSREKKPDKKSSKVGPQDHHKKE